MESAVLIPQAVAHGGWNRPVAGLTPWIKAKRMEALHQSGPPSQYPALSCRQSNFFRGSAVAPKTTSSSSKSVASVCTARLAPPDTPYTDAQTSGENIQSRPGSPSAKDDLSSARLLEEIRAANASSAMRPAIGLPQQAKSLSNQAVAANPSSFGGDFLSGVGKEVLQAALSFGVREDPLTNDQAVETNWAPVRELGNIAGPLCVLEGRIPQDFPAGMYVRNGPNPCLPPLVRHTPWGRASHHLFEGDGMLHGTALTPEGAFYTNRFVATEGLGLDQAAGKSLFWGTFNADPGALLAGFVSNLATGGAVFKKVANTSVVAHHGRVLALHEASLPTEIQLPSLETVGEYDFNGEWKEAVTAHPKGDPLTGELVFFCYRATAPHVGVAVASPEGRIVHRVDLDLGRATPMHDFAITPRFTILVDEPLTINPQRMLQGKPLVDFEPRGLMRFGILPRFGSPESVRWFEVESGFTFHFMNAYEDGAEVVVHAFRQQMAVLRAPEQQSWEEFLPPKYVAPKGELLAHLHEWRFNMESGRVTERQLGASGLSGEFPRINDKWTGLKYRYGYGAVVDIENSVNKGKYQLYGSIAKFHLPSSEPSPLPVKTELHSFGPGRYGGEATFVPRVDASAEDDGWLLTYVHDENTQKSELYVIDAQHMEGPPAVRIALPSRVPYGFHGNFIPA